MNEKVINQVVESAIQKPTQEAVKEAVNKLLGEAVKVGQTVAVVDDESATVSGFVGKGRVKSLGGNDLSGYADVELPNGSVVKCQTSLLVSL
jgi:hypothetical protein